MCAYLSVFNESTCPAITVLVNDVLFFKDIIYKTSYKLCPTGSVQIIILNNREKILYDLYIGINPKTKYILKVHTGECIVIQAESS